MVNYKIQINVYVEDYFFTSVLYFYSIFRNSLTYLATVAFMRIDPTSSQYFPVFAIGSLVGICGLVVIARLLFKTIVTPLQEVSVASQRIATGDLSFEVIEYTTQDEIGDLSRAFIQCCPKTV